jgi:carbonic anhydrase/acetyltransferase-like protein (isoleucine patch superfamily)
VERSVRLPLGDRVPEVDESAWVAPGATLVGSVCLEEGASVWYGCVLRGDGDLIRIGAGSNIQDGTVVHADPGIPVAVGRGVSVGHRAVLHGTWVGDDVLVGMGAILLNRSRVGEQSLVAAGTVVLEGTEIPPRSLVVGTPGRVRRQLTDEEVASIRDNAETYRALSRRHAAAGRGQGKETAER